MNIDQLRLKEQQYRTKLAELKVIEQQYSLAPHCNVPIDLFRDGSRWVCMFHCHPDPLKCVVAYGESPQQACSNFDHLWVGTPGFLLEEEEEPL